MPSIDPLSPEQKKLVADNAPLAKFLARKRWEMAPGALDYEELVSLAYQGLVTAASRWRSYSEENGLSEDEIASGEGFSIFSRKRIIGSILDWQKRDADHVPRSYRTDYKILQRAGYPERTKNYEELARITTLPVARISLVITAVERAPVSFHEMIDDEGNVVIFNEPVSHHNVEDSVLLTTIGEAVADRVSKLPEIQQIILALRYFEGLELQLISAELHISLTVVRDAHNAAIQAVRDAMVTVVTTQP
jgi:RNA polymerase sigma factor for flagellar operon FliA